VRTEDLSLCRLVPTNSSGIALVTFGDGGALQLWRLLEIVPDERSDFDSPWKDLLERFLQAFLALCFPKIEAAIDWFRGFDFLDKELQAAVRDADSGRQYVDKLVRVWRKDGRPQWVLIHLEIQSQPDAELAQRIFRYHCRLREAHAEPVVSLGVLADEDPQWRPQSYQFELWGCEVRFQFPVCKLLELSDAMLDSTSGNPVALLILAHRAAQRTRRDSPERGGRKWELIRQLYERGWERKEVLELYRLLDWLLPLSARAERVFQEQVRELEKEKAMSYISSAERIGIEKGLEQGLHQGLQTGRQEGLLNGVRESLLEVLEARFGAVPAGIQEAISSQSDLSTLRRWHRQAITIADLAVFRERLENESPLP